MQPGLFRSLYGALLDADTSAQRRARLQTASPDAARQIDALAPLRHREPLSDQHRQQTDPERQMRSHELYALGRISDYLLELGCPGHPDPKGAITRAPQPAELAVHTRFLTDLGLTPFEHAGAFSPFHHEIIEVIQDQTSAHVTLDEVVWPGLRLGELQMCRAGVIVRAPAALVDRRVATSSILWFTHRREPRRAADHGTGWGSNSQWRSQFSRFYEDDHGLHCNWDGYFDITSDPPVLNPKRPGPDPNEDLPIDRRRELLLHRCFVRAPIPGEGDDWLPLVDRMTLRVSSWPLPGNALRTQQHDR